MQAEKTALNMEQMQNANRSLLLKAIRENEQPSRSSIADASGLNRATVTNIVSDLIRFGFVEEAGSLAVAKGRRPVHISFSDKSYRTIGVRVTRKYFSIGLYGLSGKCRRSERVEIPKGSEPDEMIRMLIEKIELYTKESDCPVLGAGVAVPGPVFNGGERVAPISRFEGWERINVKAELSRRFPFPVLVEQDAKSEALVEWYSRKLQIATMIFIDAGQGVGAAVIVDGLLLKGYSGGAGEVGHMCVAPDGPGCECGSRGCLELFCTTFRIMEQAESVYGSQRSLEQLVAAYNQKDDAIVGIINESADYLGIGVANLINIFNPNIVVLAGELLDFGDGFVARVAQTAESHSLKELWKATKIERAANNGDRFSFAGANLVIDRLVHNSAEFISCIEN